jgi:hypothetical protein
VARDHSRGLGTLVDARLTLSSLNTLWVCLEDPLFGEFGAFGALDFTLVFRNDNTMVELFAHNV